MGTAQEQADYLTHFRSDSIVRDAEFVRKILVPRTTQNGRWSILGQSYGGFCCIHYLSCAPDALSEVLVTGGIPPDIASANSADDVYERTYQRVLTQNKKYYQRYPGLIREWLLRIHGQEGFVRLPSGSKLTPRSFQLLGCSGLGFSGGFDRLHYLLETAFDGDQLSYKFLKSYESWMSWETNPLYVLLHESIYTQGPATQWAAHRVRHKSYEEAFDAAKAALENRPVNFTGEMVFPWMFEDFKELMPLKETAEILAHTDTWTKLYDLDILALNAVYTASATYYEDMFVDFELAQKSVLHIKGMRQWITNEYMHSGLRDDGNKILERLIVTSVTQDGGYSPMPRTRFWLRDASVSEEVYPTVEHFLTTQNDLHDADDDLTQRLLKEMERRCEEKLQTGTDLEKRTRSQRLIKTNCESRLFEERLLGGSAARLGKHSFVIFVRSDCPTDDLTEVLVCAQRVRNEERVIYVDTTNSFSAQRLLDFAQNEASFLSWVDVFRVHDVHQLHQLVDQFHILLGQTMTQPSVLIVDSISAILEPVCNFSSKQSIALLECMGRALRILADTHHVAILVTNHEVGRSSPGSNERKRNEPGEPALGNIWRHQVHRRVHIRTENEREQCVEAEDKTAYIQLEKHSILTTR